MIVGGTRLAGLVDRTHSGHVLTRFVHIWFIPLIPLSSFFVMEGRAVKIPFSIRSVIAAYLRGFGVLAALGGAGGVVYLLAFGFVSDLEIYLNGGSAVTEEEIIGSIVFMAVLGVLAVLGVIAYFVPRLFDKASPARCLQLGGLTGISVVPLSGAR